jgi:hypothetical protein
MSKALVIGNGESRSQIDFKNYQSYTLIGCNAIHRDITVDHLICCDRRMAEEATNNPNTKNSQVYVRPTWFNYFRKIKKNKNVKHLPPLPYKGETKKDDPDHWGSGGFAVLLAAVLQYQYIELIGFDLYPTDQAVNNIYKDTQNYAKLGSRPVDPSYWIYQIGQIFRYYPDTTFVIRNKALWKIPEEWQKNNVEFVAI